MSLAHCVPLPSSVGRLKWVVVIVLILIAAASRHVAELLGLAASAATLVGANPAVGSVRPHPANRSA